MAPNWPDSVLRFWFTELSSKSWFEKSDALDRIVRDRFAEIYAHVFHNESLEHLTTEAERALAALVVLDQFPRNIFRGTARMFEADAKALPLARDALSYGLDRDVAPLRRLFFYLPFEHSEVLADQELSVMLFEDLGDAEYLRYAEAHRDIIRRFGRFPHRNALLGRPSTPAELSFLAEPGSSF